jgi:hypothetical protein
VPSVPSVPFHFINPSSHNKDGRRCTPHYRVALKLPTGLHYIEYENEGFVKKDTIHDWIHSLYQNKTVTNYINYNDDHADKMSSTGGHCKGCLAWNYETQEVFWLIHSAPEFMIYFTKDGKLDTEKTVIDHSEQIYGQSFVFLSGIHYSLLNAILTQLSVMNPFIDDSCSTMDLPKSSLEERSKYTVSRMNLFSKPMVDHIAKSPREHIDIYSEYIQPNYGGSWNCETWIRGHHIEQSSNESHTNTCVTDNKMVTINGSLHYTSTHDHSKYACNDNEYVFIGDLNRMTSQYHRGGGGVVIQDAKLAQAFRSIMVKSTK